MLLLVPQWGGLHTCPGWAREASMAPWHLPPTGSQRSSGAHPPSGDQDSTTAPCLKSGPHRASQSRGLSPPLGPLLSHRLFPLTKTQRSPLLCPPNSLFSEAFSLSPAPHPAKALCPPELPEPCSCPRSRYQSISRSVTVFKSESSSCSAQDLATGWGKPDDCNVTATKLPSALNTCNT